MEPSINNFSIRPGYPDFSDLPWGLSLSQWEGACSRLEEAPRGITRHTVVYVNYDGILYALKEMPAGNAEREFNLLVQIESLRIPAVTPIGNLSIQSNQLHTSVLITRYLEHSIPYRSLFMTSSLIRYRKHLLDAIAGLLVQIHLAGIYWGDCSLSNTLFRRDAGTLRAYLVDAETAAIFPERIPASLRHQELDIMEEIVDDELAELASAHLLFEGFPTHDTGAYIRLRYQRLWDEITHEETISPTDSYKIQERIRALNALGFSINEVEFQKSDSGDQIRLRVVVSDRNFHRDHLVNLTGIVAEEMQARQMMNEIQELRANLSKANNRTTSLDVAAYHWLTHFYQPAIQRLKMLIKPDLNATELYCLVLEHKWYLSEQASHDVGHVAAVDDYIQKFAA